MMKKTITKMIICVMMSLCVIVTSECPAFADTQTKNFDFKGESGYDIYTVTVTQLASRGLKKLDCLGVKKTKYTSGSVTVTKTQSTTFTASTSLGLSETFLFKVFNLGFSSSYGFAASTTTTVSAGTTLKINDDAPSGIYYAYVGTLRNRVNIKYRTCTLNHTGWHQYYDKTILYMPVPNSDYLTVKRDV